MSTALVVMKVTSLLHRVDEVRYMQLDLFNILSICFHLNACGCKGNWLYCIVLYCMLLLIEQFRIILGCHNLTKKRELFYDSAS